MARLAWLGEAVQCVSSSHYSTRPSFLCSIRSSERERTAIDATGHNPTRVSCAVCCTVVAWRGLVRRGMQGLSTLLVKTHGQQAGNLSLVLSGTACRLTTRTRARRDCIP